MLELKSTTKRVPRLESAGISHIGPEVIALVPRFPGMVLALCVDVFVEDLFVSFRFKAKENP